jgi:hypothetical protein
VIDSFGNVADLDREVDGLNKAIHKVYEAFYEENGYG